MADHSQPPVEFANVRRATTGADPLAIVDRNGDPSTDSPHDWIEVVLDETQHSEGTEYIAAIVHAVLAQAEYHVPAESALGDSGNLAEKFRMTLLPTWNLCWQIFHRKVPLSSYYRREGLAKAFTCAGDQVLPVVVAAQLYFDYATFARNYALLRDGLRALDAALPTGTSKEDFALFRAVEVLSSVHESCTKASHEARDTGASEIARQTVSLPPIALALEVERAAITEDVGVAEAKKPATIKTLSYLMRVVELLPMADSEAGKHLVQVEDFYRLILDQATRSVDRDGRSDNGKSDVYFRCARAHHALGDIDQALVELRRAMSLVDDSNVYVTEQYFTFHRDLEQEQSIRKRVETQISAIDDVLADKLDKNLEKSRQQIQAFAQKAAEDTRHEISGALFRVVEILGVFMALIGLIATTIGTAIFAEGNLGTRVALLIGGYLAVVSFFVLLRWIVRGNRLKEP